ncbi:MAG: 50S ribosomal protein L30 [Propionibacteriaceae bacterium]|nr:50S ribosomal protein L30 [Propionibacteriaceae bacterium]
MATKKAAQPAKLAITQTKSDIGQKPAARKTLRALGLTKIGCQVQQDDVPTIRGMVRTVSHLVAVEEVK